MGQMNGWMEGLYGLMGIWMDGWMDGLYGLMDGLDKWMDGWMDGWIIWTDGYMDGPMKGQVDGDGSEADVGGKLI